MNVVRRPPPPEDYDENPEWTAEDTANSRRGAPWIWDAQDREREALREAVARIVNTPAADLGGVEAIRRDLRDRFPDLVRP